MTDEAPREPSLALLNALAETRSVPADEWTEGTLVDLAVRYDRVVGLVKQLAEIQAWLEIELSDRMETDIVAVPGVGRLKRTETTSSAWKQKTSGDDLRHDLAVAIAAEIALDLATGELDPVKRNIAVATMRAAYDAIPAFSSLKAAGHKRFRVSISDYRDYSTFNKVTLEVEPRD